MSRAAVRTRIGNIRLRSAVKSKRGMRGEARQRAAFEDNDLPSSPPGIFLLLVCRRSGKMGLALCPSFPRASKGRDDN
eukprot:3088571-Pyramimonas_sp.AAC.1